MTTLFIPPNELTAAEFGDLPYVNVQLVRAKKAVCNAGGVNGDTTVVIGPEGGTLTYRGHSLRVPAGAVRQGARVTFSLEEPAHPWKLRVIAEASKEKDVIGPVYLTVYYGERCPDYCTGSKKDLPKWAIRERIVVDDYVGGADTKAPACRIHEATLVDFSNYALASAN